MITLKCWDGTVFEVEEAVAFVSPAIKRHIESSMIGKEDDKNKNMNKSTFNIAKKISGPIMSKVLEYCNKHVNDKYINDFNHKDGEFEEYYNYDKVEYDLRSWDSEFIESMDLPSLYRLSGAADCLQIMSLSFLSTEAESEVVPLAGNITAQQFRNIFDIKENNLRGRDCPAHIYVEAGPDGTWYS